MWIYESGLGRISRNGATLAMGYSGFGEGKNNPAMQDIHDVGPIPEGFYSIESPRDTVEHGDYVLPLVPKPGNIMFARAGFLLHGDSRTHPGEASKGCIITMLQARERIWTSGDHDLQVVKVLPSSPDLVWPNA